MPLLLVEGSEFFLEAIKLFVQNIYPFLIGLTPPPPPQPIHDQLVLTKTIWKMHADGSPRVSSPGVFGVLLWGRGPEHRSSPGEFARRLRQCQIFPTFRSSEQHTMKRGQSLRLQFI